MLILYLQVIDSCWTLLSTAKLSLDPGSETNLSGWDPLRMWSEKKQKKCACCDSSGLTLFISCLFILCNVHNVFHKKKNNDS